ncbi:protein commissureless 1 [Drosophila madeirensis]|uniref:Protein commissureless 1 n=1 Tax=Drosophila madeirensis TaxID=30013 RepID=A0AAU9FKE6_DROMD
MKSTTDYPSLDPTTAAGASEELYARFISAPASSMSTEAIAEHMQQNQITFEIPSAHDMRHIDALNSFNALLQRIGNAAVSYDAAPPFGWTHKGSISTEQLSKSVVLDLADLRDRGEDSGDLAGWWNHIFGDADMLVLINYLWIGVISSLVVLSLVFILFSCYFYRKFRTWKKCNKDIRTQIHSANDSYSLHGAGSHLDSCDASRLLLHQSQQPSAANSNEASFYQIESPPCYTIATGLPSYDEALHHQPHHFAYGMKFVYPCLAAVHHHHHHHPRTTCTPIREKTELKQHQLNKLQKCKLSAAAATEEDKACISISASETAMPAVRINIQDEEQSEPEHRDLAVVAAQSLLPADTAGNVCATLVVVVAS